MTVYESLANWLNEILVNPENEFPPKITVIDQDVISEAKKDFPDLDIMDTGLFSNPNDSQTALLSGRVRHEDYKTWYIKRDFLGFPDRLTNEAFFEKLRNRIHLKNLRGQYPQDNDRKWRGVSYQGGIFVTQRAENNEYAIYQVNLKIVYED